MNTSRPGASVRLSMMISLTLAAACAQAQTPTQLGAIRVQAEEEPVQPPGANNDIVRSADDVQPYVIVGREAIERSGATTLEDVLRQFLPMNTNSTSGSLDAGGFAGASSKINLRGLGAGQTLVLINGRRVAGVGSRAASEAQDQPDLNGIPLTAIERIEILPASAAAIYGGGAVGGVVNVIMRRDYAGLEVGVRYDIDTRGDAPNASGNFVGGWALEGGRTQILLSGQYQKQDALRAADRNFKQRGRARQLANDPASIYLPAGTSGNPPAGAQVNIRSANGSPLFGPGSSHFTTVPVGYRGWQLDGLAPLQANQGTYNLDLAHGTLSSWSGELYQYSQTQTKSINLSIRRQMTETLELFAEYARDERLTEGPSTYYGTGVGTLAASSPNNPFGQDVRVSYPVRLADRDHSMGVSRIETDRAGLGLALALPGDWQLTADYSWSHNSNNFSYMRQFGSPTLAQAINAGTVDVLRDTTSFATLIEPYANRPYALTESELKDTTLRAIGPLFDWYAGTVMLAAGLERRQLRNEGVPDFSTPPPPPTVRSQRTDSAYLEVNAPLVSPDLRLPGLYSLDLQLAVRHEDYTVNTGAGMSADYQVTMPTFGLRYQPFNPLILRGSFSKGFAPPSYSNLSVPTLSETPTTVNDPRRGGEANVDVYTLSGGNPNLEPEESENLNIGLVFTPNFAPGLRVSADYYRIEKSNNIQGSISAQQLLQLEDLLPGRVTRDPAVPGDPFGVGAITQLYTGAINLAVLETAGVDFSVGYRMQTSLGSFDINVLANHTDYYRTRLNAVAPLEENVGIPSRYNGGTPLDFRGSASVTWTRDAWVAGWFSQFYDSYQLDPNSTTAIVQQGRASVASQIYHDAFLRYTYGNAGGNALLEGLEVTLGVKNLFDTAPPVDMSKTSNYFSTFGDPRLQRVYLNVRKSF